MKMILALLIGYVLGMVVGIVCMCFCQASKKRDDIDIEGDNE